MIAPIGARYAVAPPTDWQLARKSWAQVYDLDLFDTPASKIQSLVSRGKKVHCYFSAGSAEDWRPDYNSKYPKSVLGKDMDGWAGESGSMFGQTDCAPCLLRAWTWQKQGCTGIDQTTSTDTDTTPVFR